MRLALHAGELRAQVRYVGTPAHTTNDSIVWIPERSVLFCGDLIFNDGTPFLLMGSVSGAIEVLENVLGPLDAQVVVPGHGAIFSGTGPVDDDPRLPQVRTDLAARRTAAALLRCTPRSKPTLAGSRPGPTPSG